MGGGVVNHRKHKRHRMGVVLGREVGWEELDFGE